MIFFKVFEKTLFMNHQHLIKFLFPLVCLVLNLQGCLTLFLNFDKNQYSKESNHIETIKTPRTNLFVVSTKHNENILTLNNKLHCQENLILIHNIKAVFQIFPEFYVQKGGRKIGLQKHKFGTHKNSSKPISPSVNNVTKFSKTKSFCSFNLWFLILCCKF